MTRAYIAAGSNLGDRSRNLEQARHLLQTKGITLLQSSSVHETRPVGGPPQGDFLNAVWSVETELNAGELLNALLSVEKELGRVREVKNGPRSIDLDILFFGDFVISGNSLTIPHPRLHERLFVLEPLNEIAPGYIHPVLKKTIQELLEENLETHQ